MLWSSGKFENIELKRGDVTDVNPRQRWHFTLLRLYQCIWLALLSLLHRWIHVLIITVPFVSQGTGCLRKLWVKISAIMFDQFYHFDLDDLINLTSFSDTEMFYLQDKWRRGASPIIASRGLIGRGRRDMKILNQPKDLLIKRPFFSTLVNVTLWRSDSLNISERARCVACLLGRTRGHGCQDIIPSGRRINNHTFDVSDGDHPGDVPAAGPLGRSGKNKGICSFFSSFFLARRLSSAPTAHFCGFPQGLKQEEFHPGKLQREFHLAT